MIYRVTIDCKSREIAENIQAWADKCFHPDEIYGNYIDEISDTHEIEELEEYMHQLDMSDDYASREL